VDWINVSQIIDRWLSLVNIEMNVRFLVHTAVSMKNTAFWDIAKRSLVEVNRRFRDVYCLEHQSYESVRPGFLNRGSARCR
jgi:hypothetical protein